jgi:predicted RNA-binding protein
MCELTVYAVKGADRDKVMEGVVRLLLHDDKVLAEGILGDSIEIVGRLVEVNIAAQIANIIVA